MPSFLYFLLPVPLSPPTQYHPTWASEPSIQAISLQPICDLKDLPSGPNRPSQANVKGRNRTITLTQHLERSSEQWMPGLEQRTQMSSQMKRYIWWGLEWSSAQDLLPLWSWVYSPTHKLSKLCSLGIFMEAPPHKHRWLLPQSLALLYSSELEGEAESFNLFITACSFWWPPPILKLS